MIILWIALGFSLVYLLLQINYLYNWYITPKVEVPANFIPTEGVTIVIVVHNEERSIGACLQGILSQNYPEHLFEIIVIDDDSTDATSAIVNGFDHDIISQYQLSDFPEYIKAPAYKKSGITLAVDKAKFDTIMITDGDCTHPKDWIRTLIYTFHQNKVVFLTAPVILMPGRTMLEKMQEVEQLTLMLITGAGITSRIHDLANGANMAFRKSTFRDVNGYEGNMQYASGDDMFLIEKMRLAFPDNICFVKSLEATVYTTGKKDWASLIKQRLRWAGKNKGLQRKAISRIWMFVGAYHLLFALSLIGSLTGIVSPLPFIVLFIIIWFSNFLVISTASAFFQRTSLLKSFVPLQFLYTFYILRLGLMMAIGKKGDWARVSPD